MASTQVDLAKRLAGYDVYWPCYQNEGGSADRRKHTENGRPCGVLMANFQNLACLAIENARERQAGGLFAKGAASRGCVACKTYLDQCLCFIRLLLQTHTMYTDRLRQWPPGAPVVKPFRRLCRVRGDRIMKPQLWAAGFAIGAFVDPIPQGFVPRMQPCSQ